MQQNEAQISVGKPYPLGATWTGDGANFALINENAERVVLVFFDSADDREPSRSIELKQKTGPVWHAFVRGVGPGQLYGYRAFGPYDPENGHRYNPNKVLLDPYAKAIGRSLSWHDSLFGYVVGDPNEDLSFSDEDSAPYAPLGMIIRNDFEWDGDDRPDIPWRNTIIYETHVKGMTKRHPKVSEQIRGTYAGLAAEPVLEHLQALGVTTVQLQPVQAILQDRHLLEKGLANYWGYNTLNYFSPEPSYSSLGLSGAVDEFKSMVKTLHRAGFEVIIDVVYNHTAEGNRLGPTLSFRGLDSLTYYKESPNDRRYHMDFTGTGNTLDVGNTNVLRLVTDSLRYWVQDMHVDGFRFDLASVLARELFEVDMLSPFFQVIEQDPVLSQIKLIAEPWDVGEGGYQVGGFPWQWAEWNGRYRDAVRSFWVGSPGTLADLATRLAGSADLYAHSGRRPYASINFITAHDGFTLQDLVSYEQKHNEPNQEQNRDGHDHNLSTNCGCEGPSDDPNVLSCRDRLRRSLLATLMLSQGVPMLLGGDELSKTQAGNNNAYCQDNEINWYDWELDESDRRFLRFVQEIVKFRRAHATFRRHLFLSGDPDERGVKEVSWWHPTGREMSVENWRDEALRSVGMLLAGELHADEAERYPAIFVILNAGGALQFTLPGTAHCDGWTAAFTTVPEDFKEVSHRPGDQISLEAVSISVYQES